MPIPCKMNPMGKSNKPTAFELVVKPGILASDMTYGFTPYWNSGGYCSVDWGDGSTEDAVTSGTALNHTYAVAGTYTIKINAECYQVRFDTTGKTLIDACSETLDKLGNLTSGEYMFYYATNATLPIKSLPEGLTNGNSMFCGCKNATLSLTSLPSGLTDGYYMFNECTNAQLPLTKLPEGLTNGHGMFRSCPNAQLSLSSLPEGLTDCGSMFRGCSKAQLSLTYLPEGLTNGASMFNSCTNSQLSFTRLPDGITSGDSMFYGCKNAEINLDTLVANAPEEGWTSLTTIFHMFFGCSKVTGSRSAFLAKCPNVTNTTYAFTGTNTTE